MAGTGALWMALLVLCPTVFALPLPEERDSEDSRKVLGSSVVTSVSVVLDDANGTSTAHFADAVGRPVGRPVGGDDIGSPVGLLTPDRYQFFTFDADGNLVKRFMTKDEVRSIIANGQKKGEAPTFYHNAPTGEGVDPGELVVGPTDEHREQLASQMKVHRVVESVQNVLKSQLASAPASDDIPTATDDLPGAPDPGASWSMILPSYLGNIGEEQDEPPASTESLMVGDAPVASTETGSGDSEHEDVTEAVEKTEVPESSEEDTSSSSEETEQATEQVTEQATEQEAEPINKPATEKIQEEATEEVQEQATEQVTEKEAEPIKLQTVEELHEQATEQATEQEAEPINKPATEKIQEEATEELQEQATEQVTEQEAEPIKQQAVEEVQEQATEQVTEQETEQVKEQVKEQEIEQATETAAVFMEDEPEDVSESTENQDETTTLQVELKEKPQIADGADADDAEDVAALTTEPSAEDVAETTLVSKPSSSSTEHASTTPSASATPVKPATPSSAELVKTVLDSDEMHADAPVPPVPSVTEEESGENASTDKQIEDKVASTETPESTTEAEAEITTEIPQDDVMQDAPDAAEDEVKEKESLESVPSEGDSSASVDKSTDNMVDTTSTSSSEVRQPTDKVHGTKHSPEERHPEPAAGEAVSLEKVNVAEEAITEVDDANTATEEAPNTTVESDESTDESDATSLPAPAAEALTNATLNDLNVTKTLGDALLTVLMEVAQDALANADSDADAEADAKEKVVVTSVSSSHSSHSTSTSVSSSQETDASVSLAASVDAEGDKETVQPVEMLTPAEKDEAKVKRHNKPGVSQSSDEAVEVVGIERVKYSPVALISPGDSEEGSDSEDVATLRTSSTEAATSAEFIPISEEKGAVSGGVKESGVEDVTAKAGSGDGELDADGSGSGDDEEGSGAADNQNGALPAMFDVMNYAQSDADFGVTPAMTTPASAQNDELFPRDSSHAPEASTTDYDATKSTEFDVLKYVAGSQDKGLTTPATSSEENLSLYDVNKYANSDTDLGVTTPSHDADELNDASVTDEKSTTTEQSGENSSLYDVNKYANSDTDLGVTTPSHDTDELNDASVTENKSSTTEKSEENSSMYDVNKYVNSDTDLGVTAPSHYADVDAEVLNDEGGDLSAENIFDVNNYVASDKDLGVTTPSTSEDSADHSSAVYDVNKYVNSDSDLGLTTPLSEAATESTPLSEAATESTPLSEAATEPTPTTFQEAVKGEETTTASNEGSAEGSTTPVDSEMMLNDEPHDEDEDDATNHLFKSPLAGAAAPNWTPVAVIAPHDTTPGLVDLRPAPGESLGLEASTAHLFEDVHNFAALCNELAFRMWLSATGKGVSAARSLVMSPFAITSLLSMIFLGAKGPTSGQMNDILRLDDMMTFNPHQVFRNVTESLLLEKLPGVATAAFVRQLYSDKNKGRMLDFYKQRASGFYDGHVEEVDFANIGDTVRRRTNLLVKKQTNGKIGEYMRGSNLELQPPLAAFGANVFQTDCSGASSNGRDGEMYFTVLPATRHRRLVPVPAVVYRSGFLAGYEPSLDATVVSLGGGDADVSTLLVLPGQQGQLAPGDGLPLLEDRLFAAPFADAAWSKLLRSLLPRAGLEVQLPRFSHRSQLNMTRSLQTMGLNDLFDPLQADLKGLSGSSGDLHVSDIVQINTFSTCAEAGVGAQHHVEIYPGTPQRAGRDGSDAVSGDQEDLENVPLALRPRQARIDLSQETDAFEESVYQMPLALRPRQAREPEEDNFPRLKFDRPFLYFVRHNPTGFILHMGRFNPRLLN